MDVDRNELRFRGNLTQTVLAGVGRCYVRPDATILDSLRSHGAITDEQWQAGDKFRTLHALAGLEPRMTSTFEDHDHSPGMTDEQCHAWHGYMVMRSRLDHDQFNTAYAVCIDDKPTKGDLITALDTLNAKVDTR